jgi:hypothetical protein
VSYHKDVHNFGVPEANRIALLGGTCVDKQRNALSEDEFMEEATESLGDTCTTVMEACEAFYMHGVADEVSGDVESSLGHFYRCHRWIVVTDNYGFKDLQTFDTEAEAEIDFRSRAEEYCQNAGDDE